MPRSNIVDIISSISSFAALAKPYFESSEDLRFLNQLVIIKRVQKVNLHFLRTRLPCFIIWVSFSATSISPWRLILWHRT